jgi:demethylmenaquinone methyltransferase/2-methoxy-6-polyprenyl-1,4-benzoquinol methylase
MVAFQGDTCVTRDSKAAHFGFRDIPLSDKQGLVDGVFDDVAVRYDLMNDLMSGGLHRLWKDALITALDPPRDGRPFALLDIAGGTGDISFRAVSRGGPAVRATVADINAEMMAVGQARAFKQGNSAGVSFTRANAEALPFVSRSFDACTIAFGIRNVPRLDVALREAFRVLRPGGRFLCLEFSPAVIPGLDRMYDAYSFNVIPWLGKIVTGNAEAYRYLVESIRRFPKPQAFAETIEAAGFRRVSWRAMSGGIVALHSAWRL